MTRTPDLLGRFRSGDTDAYEVLFQRSRVPLLRFLNSHTDAALRRSIGVDDLLQETHLEALKSLPSFTYRAELSFFFWLCGIARRRIYGHCRRLSRHPPPVNLPTRGGLQTTSDEILIEVQTPGPEGRFLRQERLDILAAALVDLPESRREAIVLRFIDGLDNSEAAAALGIKVDAFRARVSRGMIQLHDIVARVLAEDGADSSS